LALWQANWVKTAVERAAPGVAVEIVPIKTSGDQVLDKPLAQIGGKGLFTKELDDALRDGRIDLAAHSLKDVPFRLPDGIALAAFPERELPWDAFVSDGRRLEDLPMDAAVGTGSLRREVQLRLRFPSLRIAPLRGNVDTRLRKLDAGAFDGIVLAAAGLRRLGHADRIVQTLHEDAMLPAIGQGALGIACRTDDAFATACLAPLDRRDTRLAVTAERELLRRLEGSCQIPIAGHARFRDGRMRLKALIANPAGTQVLRAEIEQAVDNAEDSVALGSAVAENHLRRGADRILADMRSAG
jgi:hydroxymethylbilane synthase